MKKDKDDEIIKKTLREGLENIKDILKKKTFLCSIYFLKYLSDNDEEAYRKFVSLFETMEYDEKIQVITNIYANIHEQNKGKAKVKK